MNTAISHSASDTVASDTLTSAPVAARMNTSGLDSLNRLVTWGSFPSERTKEGMLHVGAHFPSLKHQSLTFSGSKRIPVNILKFRLRLSESAISTQQPNRFIN